MTRYTFTLHSDKNETSIYANADVEPDQVIKLCRQLLNEHPFSDWVEAFDGEELAVVMNRTADPGPSRADGGRLLKGD